MNLPKMLSWHGTTTKDCTARLFAGRVSGTPVGSTGSRVGCCIDSVESGWYRRTFFRRSLCLVSATSAMEQVPLKHSTSTCLLRISLPQSPILIMFARKSLLFQNCTRMDLSSYSGATDRIPSGIRIDIIDRLIDKIFLSFNDLCHEILRQAYFGLYFHSSLFFF